MDKENYEVDILRVGENIGWVLEHKGNGYGDFVCVKQEITKEVFEDVVDIFKDQIGYLLRTLKRKENN